MPALLAACLLCPPWVVGDVSADQSWWYARLDHCPAFAVAGGVGFVACDPRGLGVYDVVLTAQGVKRTVTTVDGAVIERRSVVYVPLID